MDVPASTPRCLQLPVLDPVLLLMSGASSDQGGLRVPPAATILDDSWAVGRGFRVEGGEQDA